MTDVSNLGQLDVPIASLPNPLKHLASRIGQLHAGRLFIQTPDGREFVFEGARNGPNARLVVRDYRFARRLIAGDVGFADGYIAGEWDTHDLVELLQLLALNQGLIERFSASLPLRLLQRLRHWLNRNTRAGSRRNIHTHYDLGNAFYQLWLDETMSYSSGLAVDHDLASAQHRKYAEITRLAGLRAGEHVLEIGCGWGGFAEFAGRMGCRVTAITISDEQFAFAQERIKRAGLSDLVEIRHCDYRDISGSFDRIVSIEMFEAVGERYWPTFFETVRRRLRPGGTAALQVITLREDLHARYRREMDFIRHYIFPGGMLPTPALLGSLGRDAGLAPTTPNAFGMDYAETCRIWRSRFNMAETAVRALSFDDRFLRIWNYYLAYCEAGFRSGTIDVCQIAFARPK